MARRRRPEELRCVADGYFQLLADCANGGLDLIQPGTSIESE
jgi:hypothetical protein